MKALKSDFISCGVRCDGDLLLPEGVQKPSVVIMAHGLTAQKDMGLMPYAEQFVKNNLAVFLFDYRTFGKSDGTPRQIVDPAKHLEDWANAIRHIKTLTEVNAEKIGLWGTSFSGGLVIATASSTSGISAVISQVPFIGGKHSMKALSLSYSIKAGLFGIWDLLISAVGFGPYYIPAIARPGTFAAMNTEESYNGFLSIVDEKNTTWENKMSARGLLKMTFFAPAKHADRIECPVKIFAATNDSFIPVSAIIEEAAKIKNKEVVVLDCNHFAPYTGETFQKYIGQHVEFMTKNLL